MKRTLRRITPEMRTKLKEIVTQELEKKGIFSKYRLDTVWGHLLFVGVLNDNDDMDNFVKERSREFIEEAWGPNGRINSLFD